MFHHNVIIFNVYNFLLRIAILITIRTTTHTNMIHTQWFINILHESLNYVPELARYFMHIQGNKCVCTQSTTLLLCSLSLSHTHCTHTHTHTDGGEWPWKQQVIHLEKWQSTLLLVEPWTWQTRCLPADGGGQLIFQESKQNLTIEFFVHKCNPYTHSHPDTSIHGAVPNMLNNTKNKTWNQHTDRNIILLSLTLFFRRLHQKILARMSTT